MSGEAVVIGSGPNGLAAAITLAEGGRVVTVLEAADHIGGAVATEELTLPGFRHDTWSSVYPAAVASPVFARWPLERHGLRWIHPRYCYAHVLSEGEAVVLARDVGETAASLDAQHPGDGAAWREFVAPYLEHFGAWQRHAAVRLPAGLWAAPPARGAQARRHAGVGTAAADAGPRAGARAVRRPTARAPGCTAARCTATCPRSVPAARSPRRTST